MVLVAGAFWFFSGPSRLVAGRGPVFSPQGDRIAFFTEAAGGATLNVYDLRSGRSRALGRASGFGLGGEAVAWSPDGRQIAFTAPGEGEYGRGDRVRGGRGVGREAGARHRVEPDVVAGRAVDRDVLPRAAAGSRRR